LNFDEPPRSTQEQPGDIVTVRLDGDQLGHDSALSMGVRACCDNDTGNRQYAFRIDATEARGTYASKMSMNDIAFLTEFVAIRDFPKQQANASCFATRRDDLVFQFG
jgi:hypothetical protein